MFAKRCDPNCGDNDSNEMTRKLTWLNQVIMRTANDEQNFEGFTAGESENYHGAQAGQIEFL